MRNTPWLSFIVLLAPTLIPSAARGAYLDVAVNVTSSISHDAFPDMGGGTSVREAVTCSFAPFVFDPTQHDGVSFHLVSDGFRTLHTGVVFGMTVSAFSSGTCTDSTGFTPRQRSDAAALVDDAIAGSGAPGPSYGMDAETSNPIGFYGQLQTTAGVTSFIISDAAIGVPKYTLGAATYSPCHCELVFAGNFAIEPERLVTSPAFPTLIDMRAATADECPAGGAVIFRGRDDGLPSGTPLDGVLQQGERDSTIPVCSAAVPDGGLDSVVSLMRWKDEPAGAHCRDGGLRLESGLDNGDGGGVARNGALEDGEVDSFSFACNGTPADAGVEADAAAGGNGQNGADGHNSLVVVAPVAAGSECPAGGQRIQVGLDDGHGGATADDGILQASEVDQTTYVCNGSAGSAGEAAEGGCCSVGGGRSSVIGLAILAGALLLRRRRPTRRR